MNGFENEWRDSGQPTSAVLKDMSDQEFLVLGTETTAYLRSLNRAALEDLMPDVELAPGLDKFHVLFAANGQPVMITDTEQAALDWVIEQGAEIASRH